MTDDIEKDIRDMSPEEKEALANQQLAEQAAADAARERRRREALTTTLGAMVAQAEQEALTAEREADEAERAAAGGEAAWKAYVARCEQVEAAIGSGDGTACGSLLDALCADLGLPGLRAADRDAIQLGVSGLAVSERQRVSGIDRRIKQIDDIVASLDDDIAAAKRWIDEDAAKPPDAVEGGETADLPAAIRQEIAAMITAGGLDLPDCLRSDDPLKTRDLRHLDAILAAIQRGTAGSTDPASAGKRESAIDAWRKAGEQVRATTAALERILLDAWSVVDARAIAHGLGALRPLLDADGTRIARHLRVEALGDVDAVLAAIGSVTVPTTPVRRRTRKSGVVDQSSRQPSRDHKQQRRSGPVAGGSLTKEGMKAVRALIDKEENQS